MLSYWDLNIVAQRINSMVRKSVWLGSLNPGCNFFLKLGIFNVKK
jgi:hypothetical protein